MTKINKIGFVSTNGQPAFVSNVHFVSKTWINCYGYPCNWWANNEQKPYIQGFLPKYYMPRFITFMKNKFDFYYCVYDTSNPSRLIANAIPVNPYNVTRQRSHRQKANLTHTEWDVY